MEDSTPNIDTTDTTKTLGHQWENWRLSPPPEGSPGVGQWVWKKFQIMKQYRDKLGLPQLWMHAHELYRGRIFKKQSKYTRVPVNLFFKSINTLKSNLTDSKPRASIGSIGESDPDSARAWMACYDTWWDATGQQRILKESVGKSEIYGYQVDTMWFNPALEGGLGEIEKKRGDSFGTFLWPRCMEIQDQPMMAWAEAMDLGAIYQQWPDATEKVKHDSKFSDLLGEERTTVRGNKSKETRPIGAPTGYVQASDQDKPFDVGEEGIARALVVEMWVKDYTMVWVDPRSGQTYPDGKPPTLFEPGVDAETGSPLFDEEGGIVNVPVECYQQSKYPGFLRCIHVTNEGKLVLSDVPNPSINPNMPREIACNCYLWDKFPFNKRLSFSDDMSEYGLMIIEQIEALVIDICRKVTQISANIDASCRPPLLLPKNCGIKRDDVNNLPGRIWEPVAALSQFIRWVQMPPLPADSLNFINLCLRLVEIVTGLSDVSEGRKPTGITAGVAIAQLQEKAQVIIREKVRNNDVYIETQGRMFISLGQNRYTEERKLTYQGATGEKSVQFRGTDQQYQGEYAFRVEAGSTLPKDRAAVMQMHVDLAKGGMIDQQALFEELGVPKAEEIIARMKEGPINEMIGRLQATGMFDDATLQAIHRIIVSDPKDIEKLFPQMKPENQLASALMQSGLAKSLSQMDPEEVGGDMASLMAQKMQPGMESGIPSRTGQPSNKPIPNRQNGGTQR